MILVKFLFILFLKSFVNFHFGSLVIIKIRIKGKIDSFNESTAPKSARNIRKRQIRNIWA